VTSAKRTGTQNHVIKLFQKELEYEYLGNWEEGKTTAMLKKNFSEPTSAEKIQPQPD